MNNAVYVRTGGTGSGMSSESPLGHLLDAFGKLAHTGGTIVICGPYMLPVNLSYTMMAREAFAEPGHAGTITITSVCNDIDYRSEAGAKLVFRGNMHYRLGGPTVFAQLVFDATDEADTNVIVASYHPVLFADGCSMLKPGSSSAAKYKLYLIGGYDYYSYVDVAGKRCPEDEHGYLRIASRHDRIADSKHQVIADLIPIPGETQLMRREPALALVRMVAAVEAAGLRRPTIVEAYRTHDRQEHIFNHFMTKRMNAGLSYDEAYAITVRGVADPDSSDHRLGLAADLFHPDQGNNLFHTTPEYAWLLEHALEYGFIVHFMENKKVQTGFIFESWHFRYVGEEHAAAIKQLGMCLEEYVGYLCGDFARDSSVTVQSGTFTVVAGGSRHMDGIALTGRIHIKVSGTAVVTEAMIEGSCS